MGKNRDNAGEIKDVELLGDAESHLERGRFEESELAFRQILDTNPQSVDALLGIGSIELQRGQLEDAYNALAQALTIAPASNKLHRLIGDFYAVTRDEQRALRHYETAARLDPTDADASATLETARESARLRKDPDYGGGMDVPWNDDDWIWEERNGHSTLFVLFAGLGIGDGPPTFIFYNFLKSYPHIDKLFIRDLSRNWYLNELGNLSANVEDTARLLADRTAIYDRTVFVGSSAGGMAAILFGELTQADKIISFAPQTVLTDAKEKEVGDQRWPRLMTRLRARSDSSRYLDLKAWPRSRRISIFITHRAVRSTGSMLNESSVIG